MTLAHSSASAGKPCAGCSKFPTYVNYNAHGIPIAAQSRQGHANSFVKHSYACRSYLAPRWIDPQRPHSPHYHLHSPRSPSPLSPDHSIALLQPHRSLRDDSDEDAVTGMWTYVFPANLNTVDVHSSTSFPAMTTSRPPHATSQRGFGPSDHHENNYFIRDKGYSCLNPKRLLSLLGHQICYIFMSMWIRETCLDSSSLID
jgi:hypothetical protein